MSKPLLSITQRYIQQIQKNADEKIREALQEDAEAQGIDLSTHEFSPREGGWVEAETKPELEVEES